MNVDVSLPQDLAEFVEAEIASGRYSSSDEVIREALRLLEGVARRKDEALSLREAWQRGVLSSDAGDLDFAALKRAGRAIVSSKA
jgi:antitoxin ParD1/3/4